MRCVCAALVAAACAAAQNEAVAALVAKYKKSAGGSPAAPTPARQPEPPTATATAPARQPEAAPRGVAAAPARQPVAGRAATNDAANLNDVVGLFAWPKKPRTVWAAAKAAITGQPEAPRTFRARPRPATSTNINDDVDAYFKKWRRVVPHCAPLMQGSCVYVAPNGGIVHARDMSLAKNAGSSKQMLADLQLRAVSASLQSVLPEDRWVSWNQVYTAAGPTKPRPWPTFAIGKREPHRPGLLMPNPFFGAPSWWARHNLLQIAASQKRSWATRLKKVLYRGACGPGARARLELMNLAESSNLLDVGFTGVDGFPSIQSCVDALAKKHEIRAAPSASRRAPHVAQTNYSQYRYLLHLPGAATGSYSRNLQYLWTHGSIVLVWNQNATEFYYRHLVNGEHYVVVDASNIVETVEAIEADPARQERLRRGARAFYDAHLAAPRLIDRWRAVLEALALRQDVEPPKIDNSSACTCDHRLPKYRPCSTCLHLEDTEMAYFMGILKKPKRPRAPDPDDVVGLARDILAATTLEAARAVARAFVKAN
jgi:hypothetical protein